jgi:predicted metal-dependent enzyme (double-stranded beta helix superfamily)
VRLDVDELVAECLAASAEPEPRLAIRDVLERTVVDPAAVAEALPPEKAEYLPLHVSPELTVLKVVWTPGMTFRPHDHGMWAAIGIYTGGEDNTFYRRADGGLVATGGKALRAGDVCLLGDDTVHAVANPTSVLAGAIHVYGGDLLSATRSEWDPDTFEQRPYDTAGAIRYFEEQNSRFDG